MSGGCWHRLCCVLSAALLSACIPGDETVSGYAGVRSLWRLDAIDGRPFAASATLEFPEAGRVSGQAPCNRYFARQTAPYPWFALDQIGATKAACADLDAEGRYLGALSEMSLAEVAGDVLILSNDDGRSLTFSRISDQP